jgi:hypothetical protein
VPQQQEDPMVDVARLADRMAIEELNAAYAWHLDHDEVAPLALLFTEDAEYSHGTRRSVGRAAIEAFFRSRTADGPRTARHLYSGLRIVFEAVDRARGTSVWLSFAQDSVPPVPYSIPFLVADFEDVYERGSDLQWRIRRRHIEPIFRDPAGRTLGTPRDVET